MTKLQKAFRNMLERLLDRYKEGPEVPPRLVEEIRLFRVLATERPTEEEWEAFATRLVDRTWRDGFERGYYWSERMWEPDVDPDEIAKADQAASLKADPQWANALEHPMSAREFAEFNRLIGNAHAAGIRVHVPPGRRES